MKFSPKLPAIYTKRIINRSINVEVITKAVDNLTPKQNVAKRTLMSWIIQYAKLGELKSLAFNDARHISTRSPNLSAWRTIKIKKNDQVETKADIKISKPLISFDFPHILRQLPKDLKAVSLIDFPILNPWREEELKNRMLETEEEFLAKREKVLENASLPASKFPSVTKILQTSMSEQGKANLERWKAGMVKKLGEVGFIQYQRSLFERGSAFHGAIEKKLSGTELTEIPQIIDGLWKSLEHVFPKVHEVRLIEKPTNHPFLCYKGVIDCVAMYDNELVLIDWKTSSREKPSLFHLYDEPIQAAAYMGALNFDKQFKYQVERMALVFAYEDGTPATVHQMSETHCRDYWKQWLARLKTYHDLV